MFNKKLEIRAVEPEELEEIRRLDSLVFADAQLKNWLKEEQTSAFLLSLDGEHLAYALLKGQTSQQLLRLGVLPRHQEQGLGTLLLAVLKEEALRQDWSGIWLEPEDLTSYFALNGFEGEVVEKEDGYTYYMKWENPQYRRTDED